MRYSKRGHTQSGTRVDAAERRTKRERKRTVYHLTALSCDLLAASRNAGRGRLRAARLVEFVRHDERKKRGKRPRVAAACPRIFEFCSDTRYRAAHPYLLDHPRLRKSSHDHSGGRVFASFDFCFCRLAFTLFFSLANLNERFD